MSVLLVLCYMVLAPRDLNQNLAQEKWTLTSAIMHRQDKS